MGHFLLVYPWEELRCETEEDANVALRTGLDAYPDAYPKVYYVVKGVRQVVHYKQLANAPSRQDCSRCGKPCKRSSKSKTGAAYRCSKCGSHNVILFETKGS